MTKIEKISRIFRFFLIPLSYVYYLLFILYRGIYRFKGKGKQWRRTRVVSVGNLSVGGTGKTPFVIYLSKLFSKREKKTVIVSRGYRRKNRERIIELLNPSQNVDGGDEPWLLSKKTGIPVIIAQRKTEGVFLASKKYHPDIILLDDGFQSFAVKRDFDVVLLDSTENYGKMSLLPAGPFREPFSSITRADVVVLTKCNHSTKEKIKEMVKKVKKHSSSVPIFFASHIPINFLEIANNKRMDLSKMNEKRILSISSLAKNYSFILTLKEIGLKIVHSVDFVDHHRYSSKDISLLNGLVNDHSIDAIITTEKDQYSLQSFIKDLKIPLFSLEIDISIEREDDFIRIMKEKGLL